MDNRRFLVDNFWRLVDNLPLQSCDVLPIIYFRSVGESPWHLSGNCIPNLQKEGKESPDNCMIVHETQ